MPKQSNKQKSGGNIAKNVSDLMVPFGLILAKDSLEKFLNNQAKKTSTTKKSSKKVSLSGGSGCSASAEILEGYTRPSKTTYASVGGGGKRANTQKSVPQKSPRGYGKSNKP
jgi:hypothetical protein